MACSHSVICFFIHLTSISTLGTLDDYVLWLQEQNELQSFAQVANQSAIAQILADECGVCK